MLYAGAGKACIDPEENMYPMPTHFGVCDDKYNSCYVRALALRDGKKQIVFVVYELSDYPKIEHLHAKLAEETGCRPEEIAIVVTHNHTSPCDECIFMESEQISEFCERYKPIEYRGAVEAVKQALGSLRPAKIGFGETRSGINVNRDYETLGGFWIEAPNFNGFSDKTLALLKVVDLNEKPIAVLMNYAAHATNCYFQKDFDGKTKLSGNFPGITCDFIEQYYGDGAVALWTSGAAGDQAPYMSHGTQLSYPDGYTTLVPTPDGAGYLQMEAIGRLHAEDAVRGLAKITEYADEADIEHIVSSVELPRQRNASTKHVVFRQGGTGPRKEGDKPVHEPYPVMERVPDEPVPVRMELVRIGDIAVLLAGAELYNHIGVEMKEASPYRKTFVMTHCHYHVGYVLDKDSAHHTVFQSFNEVVPGESEELILGCEAEMFRELHGRAADA